MEQTDIYDKNHQKTGIVRNRGSRLGDQEYIQAAAAIVRSQRYTLVTKRHLDKTGGGKWEFPGGGSMAGESSMETLLRELKEETGIETRESEVHFLRTIYYDRYHLFLDVFLVEKPVKMNELCLQQSEVTKALFVTDEELKVLYPRMTGVDQKVYDEIAEEVWRMEC